MDALIDLFTSFSGLLSLGIIGFVCLMGGYFTRMAFRKMDQELAQQAEQQAA
ncbi:DUF3149 domain-containing protein [Microbulbifer agarilyticus]|uniref:DUF3149 domain-containing protein n=1 Tax=Microbulbifer agarilyticus TaxID=260552 RepID=UPI001C98214F|nr:DUF3149 domain-containing protein [Microbulbifer agarilyticus]MBY6192070.1 DUF3149 domain-containing protein [Microbulbifer agarilyticus]MBY6213193.1 DUF3149 domain-containing protein [Microbulbifer agarilyticus]MCA0895049.1 DUF3149 domain-containing protein [Microbulbifer agarilyticus]MCA0901952.1 DUF3149 domain-containing protein [Microbulbifer agarilyticus]